MRILDVLAAGLGKPEVVRHLGRGGHERAAVARWHHDGAHVDLREIDAVRIIVSISGGQWVELTSADRTVRHTVAPRSLAFIWPGTSGHAHISGPADAVQIALSAELFEDTLFEEESYAAAFATAPVQRELTAAAIQAVVALAAPGDRDTDDALESIVIRMAHRLAGAAAAIVSGAERSPSIAHAELRARVGERLESTGVPTSRKLASAASYSIDHFVRVFRSIEGLPPHAYFDARRIERATTLLIEGTHRVDRVC